MIVVDKVKGFGGQVFGEFGGVEKVDGDYVGYLFYVVNDFVCLFRILNLVYDWNIGQDVN